MITYLVHRRAGHGRLEVVGRGLHHAGAPSQRYAGRGRPRSAVSSAGRRRVGHLGRLGGRAAALGSSGGRPKGRPRASTKRYSGKRWGRRCLGLRCGAGWGVRALQECAKDVHIFAVVRDDSPCLLKKGEEGKLASQNTKCQGLLVAGRTKGGRARPWLDVGQVRAGGYVLHRGDREPPRDALLRVSAGRVKPLK